MTTRNVGRPVLRFPLPGVVASNLGRCIDGDQDFGIASTRARHVCLYLLSWALRCLLSYTIAPTQCSVPAHRGRLPPRRPLRSYLRCLIPAPCTSGKTYLGQPSRTISWLRWFSRMAHEQQLAQLPDPGVDPKLAAMQPLDSIASY